MTKRESKGGYAGGSTVFSPKDPSWFSNGSTRLRPEERVSSIASRSLTEQAAYEAFKREATGPKYVLIQRKEARPLSPKNKKSDDES
jgi:hypothetical protein